MSDKMKVPPHNEEAERSLLSCLLIDVNAFVKVGDSITSDDFYIKGHEIIYRTIAELFNKSQPIDVVSLGNRLEETENIKDVGGKAYLVELSNLVTTSSHAKHYATIISKKATLRRLLNAANDIVSFSHDESEDVESVIDRSEQALFQVSNKLNTRAFVPVSDILSDAFERIDELHQNKGKLRGIPTGFTGLDSLLGGMQKSDLVIIAARPSVGKTAFVLDLARQAALKSKQAVGLFSLEMSKEQLVDRMICAEANVDLWKMRTGRLSEKGDTDDFSRIGHALGTLSEASIFIDDDPMCTVTQIRTKARRLKQEHGLGLIVIDYLQLIDSKTKIDNRVQEVAMISRSLKQLARELDIPVIALSQLSRSVENTKPSIPKLSHLRDSGAIEQDADVVMFLYRKSADKNYRPEDIAPEERNIGEIHIAKHRNGPTGVVKLFFDPTRVSFRNLDRAFAPKPAAYPQKVAAPAGGYSKQPNPRQYPPRPSTQQPPPRPSTPPM